MSELKIGRLLKGTDLNTYWYCMSVGKMNKGVKMSGRTDQAKIHKKYKKEKDKKDKKVKSDG